MTQTPYRDLSFKQLLKITSSQSFVGCEDDLLNIVDKWVRLNYDASEDEFEELDGIIRLERLRDRDR